MSTVPPPALSRVRRQCVDSLRTGLHHFLQRRCPSRQGNTSTSTVVAALRAALLRSSPTHAHKCGDLSCFLYSFTTSDYLSLETCFAFDPIQRILATGDVEGVTHLFGRPGVENALYGAEPIREIVFITSRGAVVTLCGTSTLRLWDLASFENVWSAAAPCSVTSLAHPDLSNLLYCGLEDGTVWVLNITSGGWCRDSLQPSGDSLGSVVVIGLHPKEDQLLAVAYASGHVALYQLLTRSVQGFFGPFGEGVCSVAIHPSGGFISVGVCKSGGEAEILNVRLSGKPSKEEVIARLSLPVMQDCVTGDSSSPTSMVSASLRKVLSDVDKALSRRPWLSLQRLEWGDPEHLIAFGGGLMGMFSVVVEKKGARMKAPVQLISGDTWSMAPRKALLIRSNPWGNLKSGGSVQGVAILTEDSDLLVASVDLKSKPRALETASLRRFHNRQGKSVRFAAFVSVLDFPGGGIFEQPFVTGGEETPDVFGVLFSWCEGDIFRSHLLRRDSGAAILLAERSLSLPCGRVTSMCGGLARVTTAQRQPVCIVGTSENMVMCLDSNARPLWTFQAPVNPDAERLFVEMSQEEGSMNPEQEFGVMQLTMWGPWVLVLLVNGLFYLLSVEDGSTVLQVSSLSWEALDAQIQMEKEQGSDTLSHSLFSITTAAGMSYFRCADPEDRYSLESTECLLLVIGNSVGDVFLVDPLTDTVLKRHRMKRPGPKHRVQSLHLCNSSGALSPLPRAELVQDRKQLLRDGEAPWNQPIRFSDVSFPCSSAFELVLGLKESQVFPCEELSAEVSEEAVFDPQALSAEVQEDILGGCALDFLPGSHLFVVVPSRGFVIRITLTVDPFALSISHYHPTQETCLRPDDLLWMIGVSPDWVGNLLLPSTSRLTIRRTGDRYIVSVKEGSVFAELSFDGSSSVEENMLNDTETLAFLHYECPETVLRRLHFDGMDYHSSPAVSVSFRAIEDPARLSTSEAVDHDLYEENESFAVARGPFGELEPRIRSPSPEESVRPKDHSSPDPGLGPLEDDIPGNWQPQLLVVTRKRCVEVLHVALEMTSLVQREAKDGDLVRGYLVDIQGNPTLVTVDNAQYVWGLNLTDLQFSVLQANLVEGRLCAHSVDATMAMDEDMGTVAVISPAGVAQGQFFMVDRLSDFPRTTPPQLYVESAKIPSRSAGMFSSLEPFSSEVENSFSETIDSSAGARSAFAEVTASTSRLSRMSEKSGEDGRSRTNTAPPAPSRLPADHRMARSQKAVSEVKDYMSQNAVRVSERGERLMKVSEKTQDLADTASEFHKLSKELAKRNKDKCSLM